MNQLVFHGKKTVPSTLRRDHWTPYFSLHFTPDENGAYAGLLAYRQLRELSLQRQLLPPDDMVITTQEDIDRIRDKHDPVDLEYMEEEDKLKLPRVGDLLPKKERAKKLMSQKKTAVADLAFVLGLQAEGPSPEEAARQREERKKQWWANINRRARKRVRRRAEANELAEQKKGSPEEMLAKALSRTNVGLDHHAAERIAIEAQGTLNTGSMKAFLQRPGKPTPEIKVSNRPTATASDNQSAEGTMIPVEAQRKDMNLEQPTPQPTQTEQVEDTLKIAPGQVRVCWADLRDAAYAESWPETVTHAELARMAAAKVVTKHKGVPHTLFTKSIHVISTQKGTGLYMAPAERKAQLEQAEKILIEARERLESGIFERRVASYERTLDEPYVRQVRKYAVRRKITFDQAEAALTEKDRQRLQKYAEKREITFEQAEATFAARDPRRIKEEKLQAFRVELEASLEQLKNQISSEVVYQEARKIKDEMAKGTYTPRPAAPTVGAEESSVEQLRDQGIEVEAPRRGIWGRIKGLLRM